MIRVLRAFLKALLLTLQGKVVQPNAPRHPQLEAWRQQGFERFQTLLRVAEKAGWDEDKRKALTLILDSRKISAETILRATEHNLVREYPLLLSTELDHTLTTLYALNLNDRYRVGQLAQAEGVEGVVKTALQSLQTHLEAIPSNLTDSSSPKN